MRLRKDFKESSLQRLEQIKSSSDGILDIQFIGGAIVITYDSSKKELSAPNLMGNLSSSRGEHFHARNGTLGHILVDLNPSKRQDGVDATTTAIHELTHHNLHLVDYLFGKNQNVRMITGVRVTTDSDLFGMGFKNKPTSGFISKQAFALDTDQYSALLEREYSADSGDDNNVKLQLRYLDEFHSSFLQKKIA